MAGTWRNAVITWAGTMETMETMETTRPVSGVMSHYWYRSWTPASPPPSTFNIGEVHHCQDNRSRFLHLNLDKYFWTMFETLIHGPRSEFNGLWLDFNLRHIEHWRSTWNGGIMNYISSSSTSLWLESAKSISTSVPRAVMSCYASGDPWPVQ